MITPALTLGAIKPSGQTKHELNRIICRTFSEYGKNKLLAIFEPTQGYGEATKIFADYGLVVSIERDSEQFSKAIETHKYHAIDLSESLRESWTIEELLARVKSEQNFKVLMPSRPANVHTIFPKLNQAGWRFNVIDVDPFYQADVYKMVEEIFPLLADISLLFVSVNPSPRYGRSKEIANIHGEKDSPEFRDRLWAFDCWRYMWKAYEKGLALIPIAVHKCWTPIEQSGIDRIYFVAARVSKETRNKIIREYLDRNKNTLKQCMTSPITQYEIGSIPILYFGSDINEEDPTNIPNADIISRRLRNILVQFSKK